MGLSSEMAKRSEALEKQISGACKQKFGAGYDAP
jgi:hypothetical protein